MKIEIELAAGINYILEGRQQSPLGTRISRRHILIYSHNKIEEAAQAIEKWKCMGYLTVLKDIRVASDVDSCVEMLRFIDQKSPIGGWLNWE